MDRLYNAFPEITKEENVNEREIENQAIENEPVRENIIVHEIANEERNIHVEPIREDEEQVLQAENSL